MITVKRLSFYRDRLPILENFRDISLTALLCDVFLLLEVADDYGQGQGHGESSTDGTEGAHQLAQTTHGVDVAVTETFQIRSSYITLIDMQMKMTCSCVKWAV